MKTINLLPKPRQAELFFASILAELFVIVRFSAFFLLFVLLAYIAGGAVMSRETRIVEKQIEVLKSQVNKQDNSELKKKVKLANQLILDYKNLDGNVLKWSRVLEAFSKLPPESVRVTSLQFDINKKTANLTGFSPTREKVIELYEKIKKDEQNFYGIDYPLENVAKPTDINFHFSFFVKDSLLK